MSEHATHRCRWCNSLQHNDHCPHVAAIEYHPDGSVKRVEFRPAFKPDLSKDWNRLLPPNDEERMRRFRHPDFIAPGEAWDKHEVPLRGHPSVRTPTTC